MNGLDFQLPLIRLSQGHLNLLEICPPHFQNIYLERLASLISLEQQEKQTWGSRFHLLMQQRELGLPIESLLKEDDELQHSLTALVKAAPEIFHSEVHSWREAEHSRTLYFGDYLLTVIYDLLIASDSQAQIFDWKTYLQPQNKTKLAKNWQTRLYLYVLAETSEYLPEQISMTYWFVKLKSEPKKVTFTYSSRQHEKTRKDLTDLLTKLDRWLQDYLNKGIPFPHLPNCQDICPHYQALVASEGRPIKVEQGINKDSLTSVAEIEEISL